MSAPAPLVYPLAGLLAEPAGTERRYDIHGATIRLGAVVDRFAGLDVDARQRLVVDLDRHGDVDVAEAARACPGDCGREGGVDEDAAIRARDSQPAVDRLGQTQLARQRDRRAADLVAALGAGRLGEQARERVGQWSRRDHRGTIWPASSSRT